MCVTWVTTKIDKKKLVIFETKILRKNVWTIKEYKR